VAGFKYEQCSCLCKSKKKLISLVFKDDNLLTYVPNKRVHMHIPMKIILMDISNVRYLRLTNVHAKGVLPPKSTFTDLGWFQITNYVYLGMYVDC
jgi:hypothetical protein